MFDQINEYALYVSTLVDEGFIWPQDGAIMISEDAIHLFRIHFDVHEEHVPTMISMLVKHYHE
jgi:hypothetical protein